MTAPAPHSAPAGGDEVGFTPGPYEYHARDRVIAAGGMPLARCYAGRSEAGNGPLFAAAPALYEALDHPLLRQLLGEIEDSGTPESTRLWGIAMAWLDVRTAALLAATQERGT